jgi:hypothetical protein
VTLNLKAKNCRSCIELEVVNFILVMHMGEHKRKVRKGRQIGKNKRGKMD